MSKLGEIRTVLQRQNHAIIAEQHVTKFPFQRRDPHFGDSTDWTHAAIFTIIPRGNINDDMQLNRFMSPIVSECGIPNGALYVRFFSNWGYGRAMVTEKIGTYTERRTNTVDITDAEVPLTDKFSSDRIWVDGPRSNTQDLYRKVMLNFCPSDYLFILSLDVERERAVWLHEPTAEQLEGLRTSRRR